MKLSKEAVSYEHPAKKPENHCGVCRHFEPPSACRIVAGRIRPEDWCRRFVRGKLMAGWIAGDGWINLELDDEEIAEEQARWAMPIPARYPPGTCICFNGTMLEKLSLPLPKVGDMLDLRVFAEVTSVSDSPADSRVEMQIVMMKPVENEDDEDEG